LAGATLPDGTFQPIDIDQQRLQELFADKVLSALKKENLLTQEDLDNMKTWPHSGFNVFLGELITPTDTKQLSFCARYLKKCPLSNERITIIENNGETIIEYAAYKNGAKKTRQFSPLHFLAACPELAEGSYSSICQIPGSKRPVFWGHTLLALGELKIDSTQLTPPQLNHSQSQNLNPPVPGLD
jgi:hypothetical protein